MRDTIDMAREAGLFTHKEVQAELKAFEVLVRADERALAAPVQDSTCSETLRAQGKAYPRTCRKCGLGPCIGAPKQPPAAQPAPVQPVAWVEYETGNHTKRPQNCGTGYCSCIECVMKPEPVQTDAWPCVIAEADFEQNTITLEMQCSDYQVGAGQHWLHTTPPAAHPAPVPMAHIVGEIDHTGKVWAPAKQPAVPDAFGTREGEHPQYVQGWNDCRAETLKMRKP